MQHQVQFIELIKQHEGIIFKISSIYAKQKDDQKDLYQEIVYQLYKSYGHFKGQSKISTYMYRVALNTALTFSKKQKKRGYSVELQGLNLKQEIYDPLLEERLKLMYNQIKMLNDIEKGLILLFLEGKKHEEISQITGFTASNVGTRISRIKEKLRKQIIKSN